MATENELLTSRIILRAMLPVMKLIVEDDPKMRKRFEGVSARIQFSADNNGEKIGAYLVFDNGKLEVEQGICDNPTIAFSFNTVAKMNALFTGKMVIPKIKGITKFCLLLKVFSLLLAMKIMMPNVRPSDPAKKKMKVKMAFYMITTALSQYNKGGNPEMVKWTTKQPERIYQITVDGDIAAYLRLKAGNTKAGRGVYTKRRPFVHMRFNGVDGAFPVVMNDVDMVAAMRNGYLTVEGSPEYARDLGDFMVRIQAMVT